MTPEDAEDFTQSLGAIVGASWRQIAFAHRQGIPDALGMTTDQWVRDRLGGYAKLDISERKQAVSELLDAGLSTRDTGAILGVTNATVSRDSVTNVTPAPADVIDMKRVARSKTIRYVIIESIELFESFNDGSDSYDNQVDILESLSEIPIDRLERAYESLGMIIETRKVRA